MPDLFHHGVLRFSEVQDRVYHAHNEKLSPFDVRYWTRKQEESGFFTAVDCSATDGEYEGGR